MEIHGIQKMTLLDYPEKVACTIFTARCNFRCPFCHNASLVTHVDAAAAISEEEVFSFLAKRQGILDGVCPTMAYSTVSRVCSNKNVYACLLPGYTTVFGNRSPVGEMTET